MKLVIRESAAVSVVSVEFDVTLSWLMIGAENEHPWVSPFHHGTEFSRAGRNAVALARFCWGRRFERATLYCLS
jgi:hypothetical protein